MSAYEIDVKTALKMASLDAAVLVWYLQVAYRSRFTVYLGDMGQFGQSQPGLTMSVCLVVGVLLVCTRWDRVPRFYRIANAVVASLSTGLLLLCSIIGQRTTPLEIVCVILFTVSYYGCQLLRIETLAKSGDLRNLAVTAFLSFVIYYVITAVLLVIPVEAYLTYIVLAPLLFIVWANKPLPPTSEPAASESASVPAAHASAEPVSKSTFLSIPNLLLAVLGIAGGLLVASGGSNTPLSIGALLESPSPVYLLMYMVFIVLGILVSYNYRLRKGMYYSVLVFMWVIGSLIGTWVLGAFPGVAQSMFVLIASVAVLAIVVSFVVFQGAWIRGSVVAASPDDGDKVDAIANEAGLTKRETEVVHLLLDGRSIPYIQGVLYISEGTARTHAKHIYTKLGVHTKQELIDYFRKPIE